MREDATSVWVSKEIRPFNQSNRVILNVRFFEKKVARNFSVLLTNLSSGNFAQRVWRIWMKCADQDFKI
jgi:hypothetical protein